MLQGWSNSTFNLRSTQSAGGKRAKGWGGMGEGEEEEAGERGGNMLPEELAFFCCIFI